MKALTLPSVTSALVRAGVQTIVSWPEQVDGGPVMIVAEERRLETFLAPPNTTLYTPVNAVVATATLDCVPVGTDDADAPYELVLSDVKPVGPITDMPCPGGLSWAGHRTCTPPNRPDACPLCDGTRSLPIPFHSGLWEPPQALAALIEGEAP